MAKNALEITVDQHGKQIDRIGVGMDKLVENMIGLRDDMARRSESYLKIQADHALDDTQRFGKMETKMALYVGMGMCFAVFAPEIVKGIASSMGH